ncbi:MAG: hypothetical protein OXH75_26515 [Acidobacteria bacterium]|nr:hypothetical protein [Acidobacteriota bacterium]
MRERFSRSLLIVYFLEAGLVLLVAPWTTFWDRNAFVEVSPLAEAFLTAHAVRGGVSGVGLLNLGAGLVELGRLLSRREPQVLR